MVSILYVVDSIMSGGVEYQLLELTRNLDRQNFSPTVICLYGERAGRSLHFLPMFEEANIPVINLDLDWSIKSKLQAIHKIAKIVRDTSPDIVHAYNYHSNLLTRLSRPLWRSSAKLLATVRNAQTQKQRFYDVVSQWLYNGIICNSKEPYNSLIQIDKIPPSKIHRIPNGVAMYRFRNPSPTNPYTELGYTPRQTLLMIGRITQQKSPHILAEAIGLLVDKGQWNLEDKVFIIGEMQASDAQWQEKLDAVIKDYRLQDIVIQLPQTSNITSFYQYADVTILASLWEGLPNVVLESLASGTPCIVSEGANRDHLIEQGKNGWVVKTGDSQSLSETIEKVMLLSKDHVLNMEVICRAKAEEYSMERMVEAYQTLYTELLS